jgi:tRNA (guanine37-N1)-methyltransferase
MIRFDVLTLFPEMISPIFEDSILKRAVSNKLIEYNLINYRDFSKMKHHNVDDTPYGGGDGMLLRCEPVFAAIESVKAKDPHAEVILPTPVGTLWNQSLAKSMSQTESKHYIILCPHYEGYDERILKIVDHQISLGKYVLTGGELPALIIIDSILPPWRLQHKEQWLVCGNER